MTICIATHWHGDRTEGLEYYKNKGIKTYTTVLTDEWSKKNNKKRAEYLMKKDTVFTVGQHSFEPIIPEKDIPQTILYYGLKKTKYFMAAV